MTTRCQFAEHEPRRHKCVRCGYVMKADTPYPPEKVHRMCSRPKRIAGLGDLVHWLLWLMGVKPARGCGCEDRRDKMNRKWSWLKRG